MSLSLEEKQKIIEEYRINENDTGSSDVQIAILTARINQLQDHLKQHKQDNSSRRGLLKLVGQRRHHQEYLRNRHPERYQELIKRLGLRK